MFWKYKQNKLKTKNTIEIFRFFIYNSKDKYLNLQKQKIKGELHEEQNKIFGNNCIYIVCF